MNDDPDQPLFGVGRKTVRRTQAASSTGSADHATHQEGASPSSQHRSLDSPTSSPPRQTIVGAVLKKFSRSGHASAKDTAKVPIVFDDSGSLEKMSEYLSLGGDANHIFPGKDPWAFLYGEKPSLLIAACYWKRPHQADIVKLLLDHGASTQVNTTMGFSALEIARDLCVCFSSW